MRCESLVAYHRYDKTVRGVQTYFARCARSIGDHERDPLLPHFVHTESGEYLFPLTATERQTYGAVRGGPVGS